jgi:hypothetical protein
MHYGNRKYIFQKSDPKTFAFHRQDTALLRPFFHFREKVTLTKGITKN